MRVRAVANGNIIDLPEDHGLIAAGIYVPVEEESDVKPGEEAELPARESALRSPEKPLETVANTAPAKKAAATRKRKPKK